MTVKRISILLNNIVLHSLHSHNNQTQTIPLIFVYFVDELHQRQDVKWNSIKNAKNISPHTQWDVYY